MATNLLKLDTILDLALLFLGLHELRDEYRAKRDGTEKGKSTEVKKGKGAKKEPQVQPERDQEIGVALEEILFKQGNEEVRRKLFEQMRKAGTRENPFVKSLRRLAAAKNADELFGNIAKLEGKETRRFIAMEIDDPIRQTIRGLPHEIGTFIVEILRPMNKWLKSREKVDGEFKDIVFVQPVPENIVRANRKKRKIFQILAWSLSAVVVGGILYSFR